MGTQRRISQPGTRQSAVWDARPVLSCLAAVAMSPLGPFLAVALGFVIASFGHIIKSRFLIVLGLLIIGGVSAYVSFALHPG